MRRILPFLACALVIGCGSSASTGKSAGTTSGATSSGATGGSSTSGSATTTGTGGAGTGGASTSGTATSTGTGTGTGGAGGSVSGCTSPSVTVDGDGATKHFDASCMGMATGSNTNAATGYIGYQAPHAGGPEDVWIYGCATPNGSLMAGSLSLFGPQAMVGTTMTATASYDSGTDTYQNSGTTTLTVTELSTDTIAGSYDAVVTPTNGNGTTHISGTFRVCRGPDFLPP